MPRPRNAENIGLPTRWKFVHGAYYYQVPKEEQHLWKRQTMRLGTTLEEASQAFSEMNDRVQRGFYAQENISTRKVQGRGIRWDGFGIYDPACNIPLTFLQAIYVSARGGAVNRNLSFDLTPGGLIRIARKAAGKCMLTGIEWDYRTSNDRGKRPWTPSLDRINSSLGYIDGNCRLVCTAANIALSDFGDMVLLQIALGMISNRRAISKKRG